MGINISKKVDHQIRAWNRRNAQAISTEAKESVYPVITISREFGALGAAMAAELGKLTGFEVWDKEILGAIAEDLDSDVKFLETLDERRQADIEDAVSGFMSEISTNVNYIRSLIRTVKTIEEHGKSIIVGRGANYICEKENSFHVRVVSPLKTRTLLYAERNDMNRIEARKLIEKKDQERADFIKRYFYKDLRNPTDYDMIINSGKFTLEQMARLVLDAYEMRLGEKVSTGLL
ncbi:cytidylate kinase-like family protein [Rhodohalobacter sp. SW132]|uniref:cytidylate kinase-like family protein n=1 Tax=Rhodohalobacter sp. SW132 TaxID=2293433 RepID=UPI000E22A2A0|nr:cytidylate kinase-like family protein [Rhodohalobacter sp. SW132]REL33441.1 cytidylate kinase-like family protein [Rhodohalobacter sp. SW132]